MSEQGERLNIRKATLREWRREFARHLRDQGIAASATERAVRGESRTYKKDGIYRAAERGSSTHMRARADGAVGSLRVELGRSKLLDTRREVQRGWRRAAEILAAEGQAELAARARQFTEQMSPVLTEKEKLSLELLQRANRLKVQGSEPRGR